MLTVNARPSYPVQVCRLPVCLTCPNYHTGTWQTSYRFDDYLCYLSFTKTQVLGNPRTGVLTTCVCVCHLSFIKTQVLGNPCPGVLTTCVATVTDYHTGIWQPSSRCADYLCVRVCVCHLSISKAQVLGNPCTHLSTLVQ